VKVSKETNNHVNSVIAPRAHPVPSHVCIIYLPLPFETNTFCEKPPRDNRASKENNILDEVSFQILKLRLAFGDNSGQDRVYENIKMESTNQSSSSSISEK